MSSVTGLSYGTSANPCDDDLLTDYSFKACSSSCMFCAGLRLWAERRGCCGCRTAVARLWLQLCLVDPSCCYALSSPSLCSRIGKSTPALLGIMMDSPSTLTACSLFESRHLTAAVCCELRMMNLDLDSADWVQGLTLEHKVSILRRTYRGVPSSEVLRLLQDNSGDLNTVSSILLTASELKALQVVIMVQLCIGSCSPFALLLNVTMLSAAMSLPFFFCSMQLHALHQLQVRKGQGGASQQCQWCCRNSKS